MIVVQTNKIIMDHILSECAKRIYHGTLTELRAVTYKASQ